MLALFGIGVSIFAAAKAETTLDWWCVSIVLFCSLVPAAAWIAWWRDTFPILPVFAVIHVFHYALPYVSRSSAVGDYHVDTRLSGALTIGGFLLLTTLVWAFFMRIRPASNPRIPSFDVATLRLLLPYGLGIGALFTLSFLSGIVWSLGEWSSVLRAVCWSLLFISAYLFGTLWGSRELGHRLRMAGLALLVVNVVLLWSSLYLYAGIFVIGVAMAGFIVGGGRVPVAAIVITFVSVTVLHAGKAEMRERYWSNSASSPFSVGIIPRFMVEWVGEGVAALASPRDDASQALADRTGMMHMLLRVQELSPDIVDYMYGETYEMIPRMLVPRIIDPGKPATRDAAIRLNVHYGVLTEEASESTSIGWGLAPEAYANFGVSGIIGLAVFVGILTGWLTMWIAGAPPFSVRLMIGIVIIAQIVNLEGDMATFAMSSLQGVASVAILVVAMRMVALSRTRRRTSAMRPLR